MARIWVDSGEPWTVVGLSYEDIARQIDEMKTRIPSERVGLEFECEDGTFVVIFAEHVTAVSD